MTAQNPEYAMPWIENSCAVIDRAYSYLDALRAKC